MRGVPPRQAGSESRIARMTRMSVSSAQSAAKQLGSRDCLTGKRGGTYKVSTTIVRKSQGLRRTQVEIRECGYKDHDGFPFDACRHGTAASAGPAAAKPAASQSGSS